MPTSPLFAFFSATREELIELHRAVLRQHVVENTLRKEQGLEGIEPSDLLEKIEHLLQIPEDTLHALVHQVEDELWEYSWYAYTDEWAWYRAKQDVRKEARRKGQQKTEEALEHSVEVRYEERFEHYVSEINMQTDTETHRTQIKHARASKKK